MRYGLFFLFALTGCREWFPEFGGIQALLNPLSAQGVVLGVETPDSEVMGQILESSGFEPGTAVSVFLADASDAKTVDDSLVQGAWVEVDRVHAREETDGVYLIEPADGLPYRPGEEWEVFIDRFQDGSEVSSLSIELPAGVVVDIPQVVEQLTPITLDLEGQGFSAMMVVVMHETGVFTHYSLPETGEEFLKFTKSDAEISSYEIPAEAFPHGAFYVVGVAGMNHNDASTIVNLNSFMSILMAGEMRFFPVIVVEEPQ